MRTLSLPMELQTFQSLAMQLFADIRSLTFDGVGVTRASYGEGENAAAQYLETWAQGEGLQVARDRAGNLVFSDPADIRDAPAVWVGSHLDSVPQGGNYDGLAGIVAGLLVQVAAEFKRCLGVLVARAVGVVGHADHQGVGLPFLDALRYLHKACVALGLDGGLRRGAAQHAVARGHTRALEAKIESKKGLKMRRNGGLNGQAGHACPASGEIIQACSPKRASALS